MTSLVTGEVTSLAFGGSGIIRKDGLVIFVPFTTIGDQITCRIVKTKKTYAIAEIVSINRPSPHRIIPKCPYFGTCGGCQLQHMDYPSQITYKRSSVMDALKRIGHLSVEDSMQDMVSAQQQWAYRRHIQLHLHAHQGFFTAGYIGTDHHSHVEVNTCPIFCTETDPVISQLQSLCKRLSSEGNNNGRVAVMKVEQEKYILAFHFQHLPPHCLEIMEDAVSKNPSWKGATVHAPGHTLMCGDLNCQMDIEGLIIKFSPHAFIQNHPEQSLNIYRQVLKNLRKTDKILDLYCGIGVLSLLLAKQGCSILGVESNGDAIKLAKENAKINNLNPQTKFIEASVETVIEELLEKEKPSAIIVNPPREGLDPIVIEALINKGPPLLVYISCMPPTLARDLSRLCQHKYKISSWSAFDMFPQTGHVETLFFLQDRFNAKTQSS